MTQSPEEEENQHLSDERLNEIVTRAKRKAVFATIAVSAVVAVLLAYLELWWLLIALGGWLTWKIFRK